MTLTKRFFRRALIKSNTNNKIFGSQKLSNILKGKQQSDNIIQTVNNTIHKVAPIVEYAIDFAASKFSRQQNVSIIYLSSYTPSIHRVSTTHATLYGNLFLKKYWTSEKAIVLFVGSILFFIFLLFLLTQLFTKRNKTQGNFENQIRNKDVRPSQESFGSVSLSFQD